MQFFTCNGVVHSVILVVKKGVNSVFMSRYNSLKMKNEFKTVTVDFLTLKLQKWPLTLTCSLSTLCGLSEVSVCV